MPRSVTPACDSAVRMPKNFSFGLIRFTITSDCGSKPSIMGLAQFNEHAIAGRGVQKGDAAAVRARHRSVVDEAVAALFEPREVLLDVLNAQADVVDALAALLDVFGNGRADGEERGADLLRLHGLE